MTNDSHSDEPIRELYHDEPKLRELSFTFKTAFQWGVLALLRVYQKVFSPMQPPNTCRFYPSCSHYMYQAVYRFGAARGFWLGVKRLVRCNPYSAGGYDPVPDKNKENSIQSMSIHERA